MSHLVALVGAGPGDPGLMTVRGLDLLERADTVVHDHLVGPEVLARAGVRSAAGHARLINVGKYAGDHPVPQDEINRILVRESKRAGLVVRLKGGDPYVFGRGGEEASYLREACVPFEVVPGVTSALAALSYAGVPITDRRAAASFHVVTGHRRADAPDGLGIDFDALVRMGGTLVFLMAVGTMGSIADGLLAAGMDGATPACLVENGTLPAQRRIDGTLATIEERGRAAGVKSPAILVVGEVCALAPQLDWFDRRPLRGRTIAVTRPRGRAEELARMLREQGADVLEAPLIETVPRPVDELAAAVRDLGRYSWIAFTSAEGACCLGFALDAAGLDARALAGTRLAAVGPATARALHDLGLRADLMPEVFDTAHLARALVEVARPAGGDGGAAGDAGAGDAAPAGADAAPVLLFRSAQGSTDLPRILGEAGVPFDDFAAYDTRAVPADDPGVQALVKGVRSGHVDAVTLTSSSGARALADAMGIGGKNGATTSWPAGCRVVCLGAATRRAAEALGLCPCAEAAQATVPALADAVRRSLDFARDDKGGRARDDEGRVARDEGVGPARDDVDGGLRARSPSPSS